MRNANVYLYAVIPRSQDGPYILHGVHDLPVSLCSHGDLTAAISFVSLDTARKDRPAHRQVMQKLLSHAAVLPAPEPTILPDLVALHELLTARQQSMLDELRRGRGLIEVRLQALTRRAADRPAGSAAASSPGTRIEAAQGTAALSIVADERAYLLARHQRALLSGGFSVKALPLHHARVMLRLACLLPRESLGQFMLTCAALRSRLDPAYELVVSEPIAPVDFMSPHLFQDQKPPAVPAPARSQLAFRYPSSRSAPHARIHSELI